MATHYPQATQWDRWVPKWMGSSSIGSLGTNWAGFLFTWKSVIQTKSPTVMNIKSYVFDFFKNWKQFSIKCSIRCCCYQYKQLLWVTWARPFFNLCWQPINWTDLIILFYFIFFESFLDTFNMRRNSFKIDFFFIKIHLTGKCKEIISSFFKAYSVSKTHKILNTTNCRHFAPEWNNFLSIYYCIDLLYLEIKWK